MTEGSKMKTPVQVFAAKVVTISPRRIVFSMFGRELVMEA